MFVWPAWCAGFCNGVKSCAACRFSAILPRVLSLLTQTRKGRGLSLDVVALEVGTDPTNLSRVERGEQIPKRELARALFEYYGGVVPLGAIFDPEYVPAVASEDSRVDTLQRTVEELSEKHRRAVATATRAKGAWKKAREHVKRLKRPR